MTVIDRLHLGSPHPRIDAIVVGEPDPTSGADSVYLLARGLEGTSASLLVVRHPGLQV